MGYGETSDLIRKRGWEGYIEPQIRAGQRHIRVPIKPLMKELEAEEFPPNRPRQICKALQKKQFLQEKNLVLTQVEGPPSGTSSRVVLHYEYGGAAVGESASQSREAAVKRALEAASQLRGMFKKQIAAHGGTEGFMRWVRSDEDEDVA